MVQQQQNDPLSLPVLAAFQVSSHTASSLPLPLPLWDPLLWVHGRGPYPLAQHSPATDDTLAAALAGPVPVGGIGGLRGHKKACSNARNGRPAIQRQGALRTVPYAGKRVY